MAEDKKTQNKKIQLLLNAIKGENVEKVKVSLDSLQIHGNYTVIEPLFEFLLHAKNDEAKNLVKEFLCSLKDTKSSLMVMDCLAQSKFKAIQNEILNTIWNTKVDFSDYLPDFVKIAVSGDFLCTFECLTVIENLEGPFDEEHLFESQLFLKEYAEGKHFKSAEKDHLISEIAILIKNFDLNTIE